MKRLRLVSSYLAAFSEMESDALLVRYKVRSTNSTGLTQQFLSRIHGCKWTRALMPASFTQSFQVVDAAPKAAAAQCSVGRQLSGCTTWHEHQGQIPKCKRTVTLLSHVPACPASCLLLEILRSSLPKVIRAAVVEAAECAVRARSWLVGEGSEGVQIQAIRVSQLLHE